jgi:hypothetical protein
MHPERGRLMHRSFVFVSFAGLISRLLVHLSVGSHRAMQVDAHAQKPADMQLGALQACVSRLKHRDKTGKRASRMASLVGGRAG